MGRTHKQRTEPGSRGVYEGRGGRPDEHDRRGAYDSGAGDWRSPSTGRGESGYDRAQRGSYGQGARGFGNAERSGDENYARYQREPWGYPDNYGYENSSAEASGNRSWGNADRNAPSRQRSRQDYGTGGSQRGQSAQGGYYGEQEQRGWDPYRGGYGGGYGGGEYGEFPFSGSRGVRRSWPSQPFEDADPSESWQGGRGQSGYEPGRANYGRDGQYGGANSGGNGGTSSSYGRREPLYNRSWDEFREESGAGDRARQMKNRGPKGYTRSDDRIREDLSDRLMSSYQVDSSDVEIQVQNGEVTLSGTVRSRAEKFGIEEIADEIVGVKEVNNQLRIKRETDEDRSRGDATGASTGSAYASSGASSSVNDSGSKGAKKSTSL